MGIVMVVNMLECDRDGGDCLPAPPDYPDSCYVEYPHMCGQEMGDVMMETMPQKNVDMMVETAWYMIIQIVLLINHI